MLKILKTLLKRWICDNFYVDSHVKVRDDCDITGKYRGSAHRDFNIKLRLNQISTIVFHNLENDARTMQNYANSILK